jgi:hypothetical protein
LPRDEKGESAKDAWSGAAAETGEAPDENGAFTIKNIRAGRRRIIIKLPNEDLFVRSITTPNTVANKPPLDVGRNGIALKSGEQAKDIKVTIAEGAAKVSGKVVSSNENTSLPDNLLVHLVPAEKESVDDVLRYFETTVADDGSFSITNIPPGKYFVLIGKMKVGEEKEIYHRPVAWDDLSRAKLRKDAEAANQTIELN